MSSLALVRHQFRFDQKVFWRNPAAVFFTVLFPIILLFIFDLVFGNDTITVHGHRLKVTTYYIPGIMSVAVVSATLVSLAINLTREREAGLLKRARGTPMPPWALVAGRIGNSIVVSVVMVVIVTAIGRVAYGVAVPTATIPALLVTLAVGAASFCCMGFALTRLIPSEDAAPAVTNAAVLPLYFLSGPFIPQTEIPGGVLAVATVFPIRNFFQALLTAFDPSTSGAGFEPGHLAVVAAWGVLGLAIAVRTFRWTPRAG